MVVGGGFRRDVQSAGARCFYFCLKPINVYTKTMCFVISTTLLPFDKIWDSFCLLHYHHTGNCQHSVFIGCWPTMSQNCFNARGIDYTSVELCRRDATPLFQNLVFCWWWKMLFHSLLQNLPKVFNLVAIWWQTAMAYGLDRFSCSSNHSVTSCAWGHCHPKEA